LVSPFWLLEHCSGPFARMRHFKRRAGIDSDSLKHRFGARAERGFRQGLPGGSYGCAEIAGRRQFLPGRRQFFPRAAASTGPEIKKERRPAAPLPSFKVFAVWLN